MLTFRDLFISADDEMMEKLILAVEAAMQNDTKWCRRADKEEYPIGPDKLYAFERAKDSACDHAGITIMQKERNYWYIINIIPIDTGHLSYAQYNAALVEFYDFVQTVNDAFNLSIELTSDVTSDKDILGEDAAQQLQHFSNTANKS